MEEFSGKDEAFVEDCQVCQGLDKVVNVLKVCFLSFRYFFITCKVQYELYFVYPILTDRKQSTSHEHNYLTFRIQN